MNEEHDNNKEPQPGDTRRRGKKSYEVFTSERRWINLALGAKLAEYRERAGLSQEEVAYRATRAALYGVVISRDYLGGLEQGRMGIPHPEKFNPLHEVLGFPGWEILDLMGYDTDGGEGINFEPQLAKIASQLSKEQQKMLAMIGKSWLKDD